MSNTVEKTNSQIYQLKKIKQQTLITKVDEDGVIKNKEEINVFEIPKEPPFVKLYLSDILYYKDMPRGLNPILHIFLKNIQWGTNKLVLNSSLKKMMAKEINLSVATLEKALTQFIKAEIMFREDKGIYIFNPYLFGCGNWTDIREIRTEITYNLNGRTFQSSFEKIK